MILRRLLFLGLATLLAGPVWAQERAYSTWKLGTDRVDASGKVISSTTAGPFLFTREEPNGNETKGFRPFWIQTKSPNGTTVGALSLYPVFSYRADDETYAWSFFELIKRSGRKAGAPPPQSLLTSGEAFDVWPFWYSRKAADPADSYRAFFPIYGTIKSRFGFTRLHWAPFPLYFQSEKRGVVTTAVPWPFIRITKGEAHGFALWPLFGWQERPGVSRNEFYLWPLGYNNTVQPAPDAPAGTPPARQIGALPFYASSTAPGYVNRDYLWPFFGYTDRTTPWRYQETRYFWPFFVQGRGDDRWVNRWGPFYTHSIIKGTDKTWIGWPVYRQAKWTEKDIAQTKTQLLYFLYWSQEQHSLTNPKAAPAYVKHVWPLFSTWNNGAGRRQTQVLSPFEVFFPNNQKIRDTWSPFFALYKYDQRPGNERHSLLWDIVTWEHRTPGTAAVTSTGTEQRAIAPREQRITIGRGLIGLRRPTGERAWRLVLFDFSPKQTSVTTASAR